MGNKANYIAMSFSVKKAQRDQLKKDAAKLGLSVSKFIRQLHNAYREASNGR